jgi:hypothetical protein
MAFSTFWAFKKRFERFRRSDVLSRRMALGTHNVPSGCLKNVCGEVDEAMFEGVESPYDLIFCILNIGKATWMKSLE